VTVVRRPLQSMVCSGRLTICDQKYATVDAERIRRTLEAPRAVDADWRVSLNQLVAQSNDWPLGQAPPF
jgi:glutaminase